MFHICNSNSTCVRARRRDIGARPWRIGGALEEYPRRSIYRIQGNSNKNVLQNRATVYFLLRPSSNGLRIGRPSDFENGLSFGFSHGEGERIFVSSLGFSINRFLHFPIQIFLHREKTGLSFAISSNYFPILGRMC